MANNVAQMGYATERTRCEPFIQPCAAVNTWRGTDKVIGECSEWWTTMAGRQETLVAR